MALIHSPSTTVRSGLIVHLDAANPKSYSGTGTTWYDMSGNSNHAILNGNANNPVWNAAGYWSFPATATGLNGGMKISDSTSLRVSTMTVELVFTLQTKSLGDGDWMALFSKTISGSQAPAISINQGTSGNRYLHIEMPVAFNSATDLFTDYTGNTWYYVTATFTTGSSIGYLNSSQVSSSSSTISSTNSDIYLGLDYDNEMFKGKMALVRVYNRALSYSEVVDNFSAMKKRFAL